MKQDDINEMEWRNPSNWTWRGPLGLYASKRDTRLIVPKATPMMGWTLNVAHPGWIHVVAGIAVLPLALALIRRLVAG
jgi:uncharacterized membrane protein